VKFLGLAVKAIWSPNMLYALAVSLDIYGGLHWLVIEHTDGHGTLGRRAITKEVYE
jgi:hypothetical protein